MLAGLGELKLAGRSAEVVDAALPFIERALAWDTGVTSNLLRYYSDVQAVTELAERQLTEHGGNIAGVALYFADDTALRGRIIALATPLPATLRSIIVAFLVRTAKT